MNKTFGSQAIKLLIIAVTLALGAEGYPVGQNLLVFQIRGENESFKAFCEKRPNCTAIDEKTEEFSNGDTFVRVKTNLTGERVALLLPTKTTAQHFMEALIKIRTAKTMGAREISVYTQAEVSALEVLAEGRKIALPIETFLKVAGAESVIENEKAARKTVASKPPVARLNLTHSLIVSGGHESMSKDIGRTLNLPVFQIEGLNLLPIGNAQISYVKPVVVPKSDNFFEALASIRDMTMRGAAVTWVTPLPWARSDKADQYGVTVIGRLIADLIESVGTEAMAFARAHAPQSQGFFEIPTFNVLGLVTLGEYLKSLNVEMVVSPDAGFQKDATLYADLLGLPIAVANKQRDPITAQTKFYGFSGPSPEGKVTVIVDDETSTGGTLAEVAQYLKNAGSTKVIALVTHLAGDGSKALKSAAIDQMVVTDSYPVSEEILKNNPKLSLVPIGSELGRAIESLVIRKTEPTCKSHLEQK